MFLHDINAARLLVACLWPGNVAPRGSRLACRWGIVDRAAIPNPRVLEEMDEKDPNAPARDSVTVEEVWLMLTKAEREPLTRAALYEGLSGSVMEFGDDRRADADKLSMMLSVAPATDLAWIQGVHGPLGEAAGVLGLRNDRPVWFVQRMD